MIARRPASSGLLAAIATVPAVLWLWPSLAGRQALSFRDQGDFFFPLKLYTADRLARGELPLWNPLSGLGEPWLANLQSGAFYPPTWLFLLPSPGLAAGLYLALHFAIGAWGCVIFLREEGVSGPAALAGAVLFAASGFSASLSAYWNHFGAWCWMPAILALARGGLETRGSRVAFALMLGLQAMAGSPEMSVATICLALFFAARARRESASGFTTPWPRRLLRLFAACALGLALAGWALVPFAELCLHSDRRSALVASQRDLGAASWSSLSSVAGVGVGVGEGQAANFYLGSLALGPAALLAAVAAGWDRQRRRLVLELLAVALLGVLLATSGPPGSWLRSVPPLDRIRYPVKALGLTFFALPMLAALGVDSLTVNPVPAPLSILAPAGAVCAALLLFARPEGIAAVLAGASLLLLLALAVLRRRPARAAGVLAILAVLVLAGSLWMAGRSLFRFVPDEEVRLRPSSSEALARISGRVLTPPFLELFRWAIRDTRFDAQDLRRQREALLGYTNLLASVATTRTAAPLPTFSATRVSAEIDRVGETSPVAGRVASRALWMPYPPASLSSRKVGEFSRAPIVPYRPRVSLVSRYRVEPDSSRALEAFLAAPPGSAQSVLVDREPDPLVPPGDRRFLLASLSTDRPEHLTAEVQCDRAAILVIADLYYPGWQAQVDGRPARLLRTDGLFRGVAVPAGSHRVDLRYRPVSFGLGAAATVAALLIAFVLAFSGEPGPRSLL